MAKYSILILVITLALIWSSATAKPHYYSVQRDAALDDFNRRVAVEIQSIPNVEERDSDSYSKSFDESLDAFFNSKELKELYVRVLIRMSPLAYKSSLKQKYEQFLQEDTDFTDFQKQVHATFKKVTGLHVDKYVTEHYKEFLNRLEGVHKHEYIHDFEGFKNTIVNILTEFVGETNTDALFRRKRESEGMKESINKWVKSNEFYELHVRFILGLTPSALRPALKQKYEEAVKGSYKDIDNLHEITRNIYEEVTGLNLEERLNEAFKGYESKFGKLHFYTGNDFEEFKNYIISMYLKTIDYLEESNSNENDDGVYQFLKSD